MIEDLPAPKTPRTKEQATEFLGRYAEVDAKLAAIEADRKTALGRINGAADVLVSPLVDELAAIAAKMEPWWVKAAADLTKGKRKSVELGGCNIGTRASAAKLKHGYENDKAAADVLHASPLKKAALVFGYALDKAATLKLLQSKGAKASQLTELGFTVDTPAETFFIKRVEQSGTITA